METINIQNLTKKYGQYKAVRNISFNVKKGEIFGFLGPNGAGKTTTIRILAGLSKPTSGNCKIFGQDINSRDSGVQKKIGIVFEESNLYERLTGKQNLDFFSKLYGVKAERVKNLLKRYGLIDDADKVVKNYSKGMKQRLLICRALLHRPELLILDEPTSGLDPNSAGVIREAIRSFKRDEKTVFLSTHYMEEADQLCDRIAFIAGGEIVALDCPDVLKDKYKRPVLEIKIVGGIENNVDARLKNILNTDDELKIGENVSILRLAMSTPELGKKLDKIRKKVDVLNIHSREASLDEVFKRLTS